MLHERIKAERNKKGLSQRELSDYFNVTQQAVGTWETGKASPDAITLSKLADFFGVTTDYLLGRSDYQKSEKNFETVAAHRTDDPSNDLPEEARKSLEDFKKFLYEKHGLKY
jgi:transcriptional regulator with XRE-family HTH domain